MVMSNCHLNRMFIKELFAELDDGINEWIKKQFSPLSISISSAP